MTILWRKIKAKGSSPTLSVTPPQCIPRAGHATQVYSALSPFYKTSTALFFPPPGCSSVLLQDPFFVPWGFLAVSRSAETFSEQTPGSFFTLWLVHSFCWSFALSHLESYKSQHFDSSFNSVSCYRQFHLPAETISSRKAILYTYILINKNRDSRPHCLGHYSVLML